MEEKNKSIEFIKRENNNTEKLQYEVYNFKQDVTIGWIVRRRVGRFIHWCLEPCDETYFSNGCLKEISKFITKLYSKKKNESN